MKKIILFLILSVPLLAQSFKVIKTKGKVEALKGTSEKWTPLKVGERLTGSDIVATGVNSLLVLKSKGSYFKLKSNAALKLNYVRKMTLDELLLALTMDEIKNLRYRNKKDKSRNTAIYGGKISVGSPKPNKNSIEMGIKQINGAKDLSENGYLKTAVLAARETFAKYPETGRRFKDRIYFADILTKLGLYNEAVQEYQDILNLPLTQTQKELTKKKIESVKKIILRREG